VLEKENILKRLSKHRLFFPLFCLAGMLIISLVIIPDFCLVSINNGVLYGRLIDVLNRSSELIILAVGMTLVVSSSAGTDISVGAVMAVSAAVCCSILAGGEISVTEYKNPLLLGIAAAIFAGILCGLWNGFLVAKMRIQPMVATLILYTAGRGIAQLITNGQITYIRVDDYAILGRNIPGIPLPTSIIITIVVVAGTFLILNRTALGMYIQSVGINSKASKLVGISPVHIIIFTYIYAGLCSGIAGLVASSRIYSADANNIGLNLELDAILAVALGGNSLGGGKFSLAGSVIGAITIQTMTTALYALNVAPDQLSVFKAIIVIIIVTLQSSYFKKLMETKKFLPGNFSSEKEAV
jgi:simple sugar transport system permease protein